ncbi:MAG: alkyl sulfatase [Minwuia thermotolerans]|nr:MAG: alkyl sulfatase [Minwuia thermotolerans]
MQDDANAKSKNILTGAVGVRELNDHVLVLPAQGNALAVRTTDGIVLVDSGSGRGMTAKMIKCLREWSDLPVKAICYSHGHMGYNDGAADWLSHAAERGDPVPELIGHANIARRFARYRETAGLQNTLNGMQFPQLKISPAGENQIDPTRTFDDRLVLGEGSDRIELLWAPSETDDVLALWLPGDGILYAGAAFPGTTLPNVGTPLRTQRFTIRWAETLDMLAGLNATILIQEFGPIVEGEAAVRERLTITAEALRWLRREVVTRMNQGMSDVEIIHDLDCPDALFDHTWMRERYGAISYLVRDICREENGWWDRNPTSLHPAHPDAAQAAILSAITDPAAVIARARELATGGEVQLALHVIDLLALAPGDGEMLQEARQLKAELCHKRAEEIRSYVSKALYASSANLLEHGRTSWSKAG